MDDEPADHSDLQQQQRLSIPVRLLPPSRGNGAPPPTINVGPRRKLVPPLMSTGQWIRQYCLDDLTTNWLATIVGEEIIAAAIGKDDDDDADADDDTNNSLQSMLIQAGDGNDVLLLIDHAEMPTSVANVEKVLTMEVAVGPASTASNAATATAPATTNAIINASDPLWLHVALAQQDDPTCCILAWTVRDSARSYRCGGNASTRRTSSIANTTRKRERNSRSKQKTAFRLTYTRTDDGSFLLARAESVDVPISFWSV